MSDTDEFEHGTDPTQGIQPLTAENAGKPWERLGISEDEWNDLEKAILDEINPGGWKGFLFGDAAESIVLDENGELVLVPPGAMVAYEDGKLKVYPLMENGVGGGLVKGLAKILGAGGKSAGTALKSALEKLSPSLRARLASSGLLKGVEGAAETAKALPRFQPGRWLPHFEDHAAEFGYRTPVEYLKGARDLTGARRDRDLHAHQRRQALLRRRAQRVRGAEARRHPADILQAEGRLGLLAGAARQGMTAGLDLDPEQRDELARLLGGGLARRAAPRLERLRDPGRARLRRLDLRVHQRPLGPRSPRRRRRRRRPRPARQARRRAGRGRPPLRRPRPRRPRDRSASHGGARRVPTRRVGELADDLDALGYLGSAG